MKNKDEGLTSSPNDSNAPDEITVGNHLLADFMNVDEVVKYGFDVYGNSYLNYHKSWKSLMPVWYKFRDLKFQDETLGKLHLNYVARLAQDLAYRTIEEFFHNIQIAIKWYNQNVVSEW